ncbi:MAG TPA: TCR/Tet family MFS transporter [Caulobacter sp.]|nr:TCR/Tet family MFS transporter [Caulobacter sp.]
MTDQQHTAAPGGRRAAFGFIFALAVMNAISFGIMIPILPNLIKQFTSGDTAAASVWNVVFMVTWGLMQFVIGPILGMYSDRYGRRPVLLLSLLGLAVDFLFMALAPSLVWLLVGRILNGMTAASFSTANAYVADVTPPEQRAKVFGWMGSAFSFGFLVGPVLGGYLGKISLTMADVTVAGLTIDMALRLPFFVAAGLTLVNVLYGLFVLPESLPVEKRAVRFEWRKANPVGSLRLLRSHPDLLGLASVLFLFQLAHMVLPSVFVLYTGYRYGWTPDFMGLTMGLTGILGIGVSIFLVQPVVRRLGEKGALLVGACFGALGFAIYGFAPTTALYLVGTPVFALIGLVMPGLMGLMSRRVAPQEQGQLQGANQSVQGISSILGPLMFGLIFAWSVHNDRTLHLPGLAIWVASGLMVVAFLIGLTVARPPRIAEPLPA